MDNYIFKSMAARSIMPVGAATASHVTREEAIKYLSLIKSSAERQGADDYGVLVYCALNFGEGWSPETMRHNAEVLLNDIRELQRIAQAPKDTAPLDGGITQDVEPSDSAKLDSTCGESLGNNSQRGDGQGG